MDVGTSTPGVEPQTSVGNPIDFMNGNKSQSEVDFQIPGAALRFRRIYNSGNADYNNGLGNGWHHTYSVSLKDAGNGQREIIQSSSGAIAPL